MDGDGVSIAAEWPLRTGVVAVEDVSASATVEGRVGSTALGTSGQPVASHELSCRMSCKLPSRAREALSATMCSAKLCRRVKRKRPWLVGRCTEGDAGRSVDGCALVGVKGPAMLLSSFSEGWVPIGILHSVGGVLAELMIERRVADLPRTGDGVWVLLGMLVGEGGVTVGMRKRIAKSRSLAEARLPAGRFDRACGTQQSSMESPSNVFSCRTWSTCMTQGPGAGQERSVSKRTRTQQADITP